MHPTFTRCSINLLLAASLAAAPGFAAASDDAVDLATVSAGPRPDGAAFGMPVPVDSLLATFAGAPASAAGVNHPAVAPGAVRSSTASSLSAASSVPAHVMVNAADRSGPPGLHATISLTLTATSMNDAAGRAVPLPATPGVVSVGYGVR